MPTFTPNQPSIITSITIDPTQRLPAVPSTRAVIAANG